MTSEKLKGLLDRVFAAVREGCEKAVESEVDGLVSEACGKGVPACGVSGGVEEVAAFPSEAKSDDRHRLGRLIGLDEAQEKMRLYRESRLKSVGVVIEYKGCTKRGTLHFEEYPADDVEVAFHFSDGVSARVVLQGISRGGQTK